MGIKLGLVGLGSFGGEFALLFKSHPLVDSIALCDAEPSKLKSWSEHPDMQDKLDKKNIHLSLDDICKSDVDALVIITQHWLHAPQCIQAMESGKDVYSAVPLITIPDVDETLDWCGKIIETTTRTGKYYMFGETTVYRPQAMFCRRKAALGEFGDFVFAEGDYSHDLDSYYCSLREVHRSRTTGVIGEQYKSLMQKYYDRGNKTSPMSYPSHSVSGPINVMKAKPLKVSALGYRNRNNDPYFKHHDFSNVIALFSLDNGASLRIAECREISENIGCQSEDFRIFGTRGSYSCGEWRDNGRTVPDGNIKVNEVTQLTAKDMRDPLPPDVADAFQKVLCKDAKPGEEFDPSGHGGSHPYLVHEFCSAIAEQRLPAITAWDAATYTAMGAAAYRSAQKDGEIMKVVDFGNPPR